MLQCSLCDETMLNLYLMRHGELLLRTQVCKQNCTCDCQEYVARTSELHFIAWLSGWRQETNVNLMVHLHPAYKDNNAITAPKGFISSLVHASMLPLPSAEGVGKKRSAVRPGCALYPRASMIPLMYSSPVLPACINIPSHHLQCYTML